jgi:rhamnosyltransferase
MYPDHRIIAVVVTYEPEPDVLGALLQSIALQVEAVVIVDNGSQRDLTFIDRSCGNDRRVTIIRLNENQGIAAAQNIGIAEAIERGADYILLLDHDSIPMPDMVEKLYLTCRALLQDGKKVAAVGPSYRVPHANDSSYFVQFGMVKFKKIERQQWAGKAYVLADFLISSGCLIPTAALEDIGPMDETLFIDHVDTDWFLRARAKNYLIYGVPDALMEHFLGDSQFMFRLGKPRMLPVHKPIRFYYIFRNSILLYRRTYAAKKWILNDLVRLGLMFIVFTTCIHPRGQYLKMIGRGIADGIRGISGKFQASFPGAFIP